MDDQDARRRGEGHATPAADVAVDDPHVRIPVDGVVLDADLAIPARATGLVLFAHGSGSGRASPRNRQVAAALRHGGLATLLLDLLTADEARDDAAHGAYRFDVPLLAARLGAVTDALAARPELHHLPLGYFGASTGAAAALRAAAGRPARVGAIVSRGGRPDLARAALSRVRAPTLLIVGGADAPTLEANRAALPRLAGARRLEIVAGAGHLFEEPGALETVARLALAWFARHLAPAARAPGITPSPD